MMLRAQDFARLAAEGHNRIPLVREILSDLDTPLSVFLKLADAPGAFLLESVEGGETWGRYSIIGLPAASRFTVQGGLLREWRFGRELECREVKDPLAEIERIRARYRAPRLAGMPAFSGGLVGYFGFECVDYIEPRLRAAPSRPGLGAPEIDLLLAEELAVFDNLKGRLFLIVHADPSEPFAHARAERRLDALAHRIRHGASAYPDLLGKEALAESDFRTSFPREDFLRAVERIKDYIAAGDAFQVVLSQRLSLPFRARPVDVYRALRALNPSPYLYYLDFGDTQVIGSSPEILVRKQGDRVTVRPIAGTRPRGRTPEEDDRLEAELLADPKERAEHLMLVDLGRNDVGRIAVPGSVEVGEQFVVERYSHVMHLVSEVSGRLRPGLDFMDVFRATFPAGTVSGAPKVRALEIIRELEPVRRDIYAGAVGYIGWHDDADLAIAIRTAVLREGMLHVQAGAGIVHDSVPEREWEETMNKGRALFRAVAEAAAGL
ncbi:MAG: anthranilate synthase component I [Lysobacterales bacterium]|jgi:anthranilate synthase component 1|nr:MAG: anthranilate synthase component I [Xanthomonadales bacterium]